MLHDTNHPSMICRALGLVLTIASAARGEDRGGVEFFEKRIRPVLVEQCYECHSGRAKKIQGELRLDSRDALRRGGESGPVVVPGKPAESLIMAALKHESLEMPPEKQLAANVVADFEHWIEIGAPDPRETADGQTSPAEVAAKTHWAFQPLRLTEPPNVTDAARVASPIDKFIFARLEKERLALSPPADSATLARRAYFDLLGLPPTPEEMLAFQEESIRDPQSAFRNLVDRLLESPHYGERWGRHWLDVARYADNKGYVFFEDKRYPWAWTYRDYVIRAFNEDLPFDRFVLQQLAADQLDLQDDRRPLTALGFLTVGPHFMNNTHDILDDRIDVVTRGLMGITVTCARCHDHKYDPVSQDDYYALYGVFRSSIEPTLLPEFVPAAPTDEYKKFAEGMQERLKKLDDFITAQRDQLIEGSRRRAAEYLLAVHEKRNHPDTERFMLLTDKGALNPAMVHRWEVYLKWARRANDPVWTVWHAYSDLSNDGFVEAAAAVHATLFGGASKVKINRLVRERFAGGPPASMAQVAGRYGELFQEIDQQWQRESQQQNFRSLADGDAEAVRQVLYGNDSPPMVPRELSWGFLDLLPDRPTQDEYKGLLKEVETWSMDQPGAPPRAMALVDAAAPYDPVVFIRGNPNREGHSVARRFPTFLSPPDRPPFSRGSGRLELAQAIVDPANPLTARVFVNRVWLHHFGRGLVDTPSDFGLRSDSPSHPELLDWLAKTFIESGWSVKQLHRTIMNSAVYQQAGSGGPREADPTNRLLARFGHRRLDFEAMRDSLLAVSGALDRTIGGPPVNTLEGFTPRRTVYGSIDRMDLPGLLRSFDYPDPAATSPARDMTTVAPQALFFMNNDFTVECARRLIARPDVSGVADPAARIDRIYRIVYSRPPADDELALARDYLQKQPLANEAERWVDLAHALLMSNEFLFVD